MTILRKKGGKVLFFENYSGEMSLYVLFGTAVILLVSFFGLLRVIFKITVPKKDFEKMRTVHRKTQS